jgi:eukaryotic-like serine/threonine-protein kinase
MGYAWLAGDYYALGEVGRASEYFTKAFELREHASERERLYITALYFQSATGELDKAAQAYQQLVENYPRYGNGYYDTATDTTVWAISMARRESMTRPSR